MAKSIVLIMGDHIRGDALHCNLREGESSSLAQIVRTPNIDRLAKEGVSFLNAFTPDPICVPARAVITTGNYSHKCTGLKSNSGRIKDDQPKLAGIFASAGYRTCAIGKLHYVPYSPPGESRLVHGFEYVELNEEGRVLARFDPLGEMEGLEDYHDFLRAHGWSGYTRAHGIGNNDVHPSPSPLPLDLHEEAWVAERSIAWLRQHIEREPEKPFLLFASFAKPHPPYDPPRPYDSLYDPRQVSPPLGDWEDDSLLDDRDRELAVRRSRYGWHWLSREAVQLIRSYYCGMMTLQDAMIGRIIEFLEETGLLDETIVIYTTDHGDLLGDLRSFFKAAMYDGAVRIPFIWRVPGVVPSDQPHHRYQLAGLQDILPTLCALTGVNLPSEVDGQDLTPILTDPNASGREFIVSHTLEPPLRKYMLRTERWKYVYTEVGGVEELYDATRPDAELTNLAPETPEVLRELREKLIEWCIENEDTRFVSDRKLPVSSEDVLPPAVFNPDGMGWRKY